MSGKSKSLAVGVVVLLLLAAVPTVFAQEVTPSVTVSDQAIQDSSVTVASVVSDGPGWIVIHADDNGAPGPVIGHAAVSDGENTDVVVEIDVDAATETLYAMLHTDAGQVGTYEFPGDDGPVQVDGQIVTPAFTVSGLPGMMMEEAVTPSVTVNDQAIQDSSVTVASVVSDGPGWIVIHADDNGAPGPVIGHAAVSDGENTDVVVEIDVDAATETLYAMLHTDAGQVGTYEFPGDDGPVQVDGQIVTPAFTVTMEAPEALPETGEASTPWMPIALVGGIALLMAGVLLLRRQRAPIHLEEN